MGSSSRPAGPKSTAFLANLFPPPTAEKSSNPANWVSSTSTLDATLNQEVLLLLYIISLWSKTGFPNFDCLMSIWLIRSWSRFSPIIPIKNLVY